MHPIIFQYANEYNRKWVVQGVRDTGGAKDVRGAGHAGGLRSAGVWGYIGEGAGVGRGAKGLRGAGSVRGDRGVMGAEGVRVQGVWGFQWVWGVQGCERSEGCKRCRECKGCRSAGGAHTTHWSQSSVIEIMSIIHSPTVWLKKRFLILLIILFKTGIDDLFTHSFNGTLLGRDKIVLHDIMWKFLQYNFNCTLTLNRSQS